MPPQEIFLILDALRSILVHFGTLFHHGKARIQTEVYLYKLQSAHAEVAYKRGVAGPENGTEVNSNKQGESGKAFFGDYQPL